MTPSPGRRPSGTFEAFNSSLIDTVTASATRLQARGTAARHARWLHDRGGHLMALLPMHFLFDAGAARELAAAGAALLDVQTKLLRLMVAREGRDAVLDRFAVPEPMRRFVDWDELLAPEATVARFDILQTPDGFSFCELNVDSCVAGAEIFEFMADYFDDLGLPVRGRVPVAPPLGELAAFVAGLVRRRGARRVVILDWSVGGGSPGKGYLSFEWMRDHLARAVHPVPVHLVDERSYDRGWLAGDEGPRTLVFRGFMMDEMDDGGELLDRMLAAGTRVVSTYESEIRMDKGWFALFHDPRWRSALDDGERALVDRYVPHTSAVDERTADHFARHKDGYIFKQRQSFGGAGIVVGADVSAGEVERLLHDPGPPESWTAQRMLHTETARLPGDDLATTAPHHLVFGLYQYGRRSAGVLVRASTSSRVVNVTSGRARLAWALPVSPSERDGLIAACTGGA